MIDLIIFGVLITVALFFGQVILTIGLGLLGALFCGIGAVIQKVIELFRR